MERVFISGANRGIGLEFVRQWLQRGDVRVFATTRRPPQSDQLNALACPQLTILPMDVSAPASVRAAVAAVADTVDGLELLVNNAAVKPPAGEQELATLDADSMLQSLRINSLGPLLVAQACTPLLRRGTRPRIVNISFRPRLSDAQTNGRPVRLLQQQGRPQHGHARPGRGSRAGWRDRLFPASWLGAHRNGRLERGDHANRICA